MKSLTVSENRHYLSKPDGSPFFYLADTAWELFTRLTRDEAAYYLANRAAKGFTVIQAVAITEFCGVTSPNRDGQLPLIDQDPAQPNEAYFAHVDAVIKMASEHGLMVGFVPTWGDKLPDRIWGTGPEIFTEANARVYGEFLGRRYKYSPIIWIIGGDRPAETEEKRAIWRALAAGIKAGDGGRHLMTYHPWCHNSSADFIHTEAWLDFNMIQTTHVVKNNIVAYWQIFADYLRTPTKPVLNAEPCYEDHPVAGDLVHNGRFDDYDVRQSTYWSLLAGSCGITYGCHDVWQMWDETREPINHACTPWRTALDLPGAAQMPYARALYESRPFQLLEPDQSLVANRQGFMGDFAAAARAKNGAFAFIYFPTGREAEIALCRLAGPQVAAHWFDPRTGAWQVIGSFPRESKPLFTPPSHGRGHDWVLVLDSQE